MRGWSCVVLVLLAGCSGTSSSEAPDEVDEEASPLQPAPEEPVNETVDLPPLYYNGTLQNFGQCAVWSQDEIDNIGWHELDENAPGRAYETSFTATAGPPPAVIGATGACIAFQTGSGMAIQPPRGEVPAATHIAALTDGMVQGRYSIYIE